MQVCFIGCHSTTGFESAEEVEQRIAAVLREARGRGQKGRGGYCQSDDNSLPKFQTREKIEEVKNCTKLPKQLQQRIVMRIADHLLSTEHVKLVVTSDGRRMDWNLGGCLTLDKCAALLSSEEKEQLKAQNGGLQTLLRNHRQTFRLVRGSVRLRDWAEEVCAAVEAPKKKSKVCWFWRSHPQGCPVSDSRCTFRHDQTEAGLSTE